MGGTRCAVSTCNNTYKKAKKEGQLLSLHSFPRDSELRDCWIEACRRGDEWNPLSSHICSDHFTPEDFEADQKLQLLWTGMKWKPKLKPGAIPTLKLPGVDATLYNDCATKKIVSSLEFVEHYDPRGTRPADDSSRQCSILDDISNDSPSNIGVNVPPTLVNNKVTCGENNRVEKVYRKMKGSKRDVIYSCAEFELYVKKS